MKDAHPPSDWKICHNLFLSQPLTPDSLLWAGRLVVNVKDGLALILYVVCMVYGVLAVKGLEKENLLLRKLEGREGTLVASIGNSSHGSGLCSWDHATPSSCVSGARRKPWRSSCRAAGAMGNVVPSFALGAENGIGHREAPRNPCGAINEFPLLLWSRLRCTVP